MHEMADLLMHPPTFKEELQLGSRTAATPAEREDFEAALAYYKGRALRGEEEDDS